MFFLFDKVNCYFDILFNVGGLNGYDFSWFMDLLFIEEFFGVVELFFVCFLILSFNEYYLIL